MTKLLVRRCHDAIKNMNAVEVFKRVVFWMPKKGGVWRAGKKWIAKSTRELQSETGLSFDQVKRAVALLVDLSLIDCEQHLFGGRNVRYVRLTKQGELLVEGIIPEATDQKAYTPEKGNLALPEKCKTAHPEQSDLALPEKCKIAPLILQGETIQGEDIKEKHHGETTGAFACAHASASLFKEDKGSEKNGNIVGSGKIDNIVSVKNGTSDTLLPSDGLYISFPESPPKDAVADSAYPPEQHQSSHEHKNSKLLSTALKASSSESQVLKELEGLWKAEVSKVHGCYVPDLLKAERSQLKAFAEVCPSGNASAILLACVGKWNDFTAMAKSDYGAFGIPTKPTVAFLSKYVAAAINFWIAEEKSKSKTSGQPAMAKSSALQPVPSAAPPKSSEKIPQTMEEILAAWNAPDDPDGFNSED